MKRTLAIALSAVALVATSAQANQPQPSFVDYPTVEANVPARALADRNVNRSLPQPSFVDYVVIEAGERSAGSTMLAGQAVPQPSFAN